MPIKAMAKNVNTVSSKSGILSATVAGLLAVLIGYAGPLSILLQAANSAHVSPHMTASWVWAISIGAGVSGLILSFWMKMPVITAWSAPGTALLVALFPAMPLGQVVGAYLLAAVVIWIIGVSGLFDTLLKRIPQGVAAGMMAGILFQFALTAFKAFAAIPLLAGAMLITYVLGRRFFPRYAIVIVLAVGAAIALSGRIDSLTSIPLGITVPEFIHPEFTWQATLGLAIPLILVSLSGQFLPGISILRLSGYEPPTKRILSVTSIASILVAFFGGITIVVSSITAALCTGRDAHPDPSKRFIAGIANGIFFILGGLFAGTIVALFSALPKEFVAVLAGLALLGAIASNVEIVIQSTSHREASMITLLATASGMTLFGLSSAFWGVALGGLSYVLMHKRVAE